LKSLCYDARSEKHQMIYLVLLCNGDTLILLRGTNSVLKYLLQKIRAPKSQTEDKILTFRVSAC